MRKIYTLLLILCLGTVLFANETKPTPLVVGDKIPEFKYYSINGKEFDSKKLLGKKVLINFTATWCPYCIEEKKVLGKDYKNLLKRNPNMEVIVIFGAYGTGEKADTIPKVNEYLAKNSYTFPVYFDNDRSVLKLFKVSTIPTNFLIDEKGTIVEISQEYYKLKNLNKTVK